MFMSSLAEQRIAPTNPFSCANSSRPSYVCKISSSSPASSFSYIRSTLFPHKNMGIGESFPAIMSSTCDFHSEHISIVEVSLRSPTKIAPLELRQNDRLIPEKFVSMPTKSQI